MIAQLMPHNFDGSLRTILALLSVACVVGICWAVAEVIRGRKP